MPSYSSIQEVMDEVERYSMTVLLFAILSRILDEKGIHIEIEPKCQTPSGEERCPDFLLRTEQITTVIEHKASISDIDRNIADVLDEIYEKYSPLIQLSNNDQVGALIPKRDQNAIQLATHIRSASELVISTFFLGLDPKKLELETIDGRYNSSSIQICMSGSHDYDYRESASRNFIRMPPPIPYAASIIWTTVLLPLYGKKGNFGSEEEIEYADIINEARSQVRSWVTDAESLVIGFVNRALKFLNKIGWAKYSGQDNPVTIFPNKGIGQGDLNELFCSKWYEIKTNQSKSSAPSSEAEYEQITLDNILDDED